MGRPRGKHNGGAAWRPAALWLLVMMAVAQVDGAAEGARFKYKTFECFPVPGGGEKARNVARKLTKAITFATFAVRAQQYAVGSESIEKGPISTVYRDCDLTGSLHLSQDQVAVMRATEDDWKKFQKFGQTFELSLLRVSSFGNQPDNLWYQTLTSQPLLPAFIGFGNTIFSFYCGTNFGDIARLALTQAPLVGSAIDGLYFLCRYIGKIVESVKTIVQVTNAPIPIPVKEIVDVMNEQLEMPGDKPTGIVFMPGPPGRRLTGIAPSWGPESGHQLAGNAPPGRPESGHQLAGIAPPGRPESGHQLANMTQPGPPKSGRRLAGITITIGYSVWNMHLMSEKLAGKCNDKVANSKGKVLKAIMDVWFSRPIQCFPAWMGLFISTVRLVRSSQQEKLRRQIQASDLLVEVAERTYKVTRPATKSTEACSGRRLQDVDTLVMGPNSSAPHFPAQNYSHPQRHLLRAHHHKTDAAGGWDDSLHSHKRRQLLQLALTNSEALELFDDATTQYTTFVNSTEETLRSLGVQELLTFMQPLYNFAGALDSVKSALSGFSDFMGIIGKALEVIKPPPFDLGFSLTDWIGDLIDKMLKAITSKSLSDWFESLLNEIPAYRDAKAFITEQVSVLPDKFDQATEAASEIAEDLDGKAKALINAAKSLFGTDGYAAIAAFYPIPYTDGVALYFTRSVLGAPAQFECPAGWYAVAKTAERVIWGCRQDLAAFMRFPCDGKGGASKCSVDYAKEWETECSDPDNNAVPDTQVLALAQEQVLGNVDARFEEEDSFTSEYFCVRNDVDFKVLPDLFDGAVDWHHERKGDWVTGSPKYQQAAAFQVGSTIVDKILCNAGREIYLEHLELAAFDDKDWNPCQTRWINDLESAECQTNPASNPLLCYPQQIRREYRREYCAYLYADRLQKAGLADTAKNSRDFPWGFHCGGDASGVYWEWVYGQRSECLTRNIYTTDQCSTLTSGNCPIKWMVACNAFSAMCDCHGRWNPALDESCSKVCSESFSWDSCNCPCNTNVCSSNESPASGKPIPIEVCNSNYDTPADLPEKDTRKSAQQARMNIELEYQTRGMSGMNPPYVEECRAALDACKEAGAKVCNLAGCIPDAIQWACVDPLLGTPTRVYVFANSKNTTSKTVTCPVGEVAQVRNAYYGTAVDFQDRATDVAKGCSGRVCDISIDSVDTTTKSGKTLWVDYSCACGDGFETIRNVTTGDCIPCTPGHYRKDNMVSCLPCPSGTKSSEDRTTCEVCPDGFFSGTGSESCTPCPIGTYITRDMDNSTCVTCPQNTFAFGVNSTKCTPCEPGSVSGIDGLDTGHCYACQQGYHRNAGMGNCTICPAGTMSLEGAGECTNCPAGFYSRLDGSSQCLPCDVGSYQDGEGKTGCKPCPAGFLTAGINSTKASDCSIKIVPVDFEAVARGLGYTGGGYNEALCLQLMGKYGFTNITELGNGWCDKGPHNTAVCAYDKGDCCESTCVKFRIETNDTDVNNNLAGLLRYSCASQTFACKDPAARGTVLSGDSCLPPGYETKTPEPAGATCPVTISTEPRWGDGICDDDLNILDCKYDGGDCCPSTCSAALVQVDTCDPVGFNCRDPDGKVDKVAPTLEGIPADLLLQSSTVSPATMKVAPVTAWDNMPCFNSTVVVVDANRTGRSCSSPYLYLTERTFSATDKAGLRTAVKQLITVQDDELPKILQVPADAKVECSSVPNMPTLAVSDNDAACTPATVAGSQLRTDGGCPSNYTLTRTWSVKDTNNTAMSKQVITVQDTTPPEYPAAQEKPDGVRACLWPANGKYWNFKNMTGNPVFKFDGINDKCSGRKLTQSLYACTADPLTAGTKGISAPCKYDPVTTDLKLQAALRGPSTTYSIVWQAVDECGRVARFVTKVVVDSKVTTGCFVANLTS